MEISTTFLESIHEQDIFLVGGGNSLPLDVIPYLPPSNTIYLNSSVVHAKECLAVMWMDVSWYNEHNNKLQDIDVSNLIQINKSPPIQEHIQWVKAASSSCDFNKSNLDPPTHTRGNNVGCAAIKFLDSNDVKTIYLIGFDCKSVRGRTHNHSEYKLNKNNDSLYRRSFIPCFKQVSKYISCKVYNCSTDTALKMFEYINIWDAIDRVVPGSHDKYMGNKNIE